MKLRGILLFATCIIVGAKLSYGEPISVPDEAAGVYLGMSLEDFLKARPAISKKNAADPEWRGNKKDAVVFERLKDNARFDSVIYMFEDKHIIGISFYMVSTDEKPVLARRNKIYKYCAARFGKAAKKEIGVLEAKSKSPKRKTPALTWEKSNANAYLFMPEASNSKSPRAILMLQASSAKTKLAIGFEKEDIPDSEKKQIFEASGVDND